MKGEREKGEREPKRVREEREGRENKKIEGRERRSENKA